MIVDFNELKEIRKQKETVFFDFILNYYCDMNNSSKIDILYFLKAQNMFQEILDNKKLNYTYDLIVNKMKLVK